MRIAALLIATLIAASAFAELPPPTAEEKAKAAEAAARAAWAAKVGAYQLCVTMERTAEAYRNSAAAAGKEVPAPTSTAPCADPGPYASPTATEARPVEAAGAHSPPATAVSPPSTTATEAELTQVPKK
jgi:hypothetical protein